MDCRDIVTSQDYYDFIVEYNDDENLFPFSSCIQELSNEYGAGYWDKNLGPALSIRDYTYTAIPKLYTVTDELAMEEAGILQLQNQPVLALKGQGILMGFIDTGIDYKNPVFQNRDGSSRIVAVWDQTLSVGSPPEGFLYGTEYRTEQLNTQEALTRDTNGHGTYLASLAAGSLDAENQFAGAAPYASIAVVKLKEAKNFLREYFFVNESTLAYQENDIMAGVAYLDRLAYQLDMPLVLCFGLGTNWGSHAGDGAMSEFLNEVCNRRQRSVVVAAGNEADNRHHFSGNIEKNGDFVNVEVSVGENVSGFTVELWSSNAEIFTVELISPTGERYEKLSRQTVFREHNFILDNTRVTIEKNISFPRNNQQLIFMRFATPSQGIWNIRVYGEDVIQGRFHMWLPMKAMLTGEVFFLRSNPDTTITIPGNAEFPITTAGYNARDNSLFLQSGRGYTLKDAIKPDIAAPAVDVTGAGLGNRFVTRTGTSTAAAITAGAAALVMEWALVRGNYTRITSGDVKNILIRGANRDAQRLYPNREWGYGTLDAYNAFVVLRA